jgi:diguanylate cyclase (GGDEF)-like protein/PAS domain S-box-containing protein
LQLARKNEPDPDAVSLATISWHSPRGLAPPASIASLFPAQVTELDALSGSCICLLDCTDRDSMRHIARVRDICGDALFLIAVTGAASIEFEAELFDAGVDDLLMDQGPTHLLRCLLRAKRHLALLQVHEQRLEALEDKLDTWQDALDHLPTPIYLKDVGGRYIGCNKAFSRFAGTDRNGVIGRTLADLLPHDTAEAHRESDLQVMRSGGVLSVETDVCLTDTGMRHILLHKACIATPNGGVRGIAGVMIDITERKELEARLTSAAERDPLTNAFNRRKFFQVAASAIDQVPKIGAQFAVAVIDIDHFKSINDELGHGEGDVMLCSIVDTLRSHEDAGVIVARAGGEEFFAFFCAENAQRAEQILEQMRADIALYCQVTTGIGAAGTISIGLADFDPQHETVDQALRRADLALYRAKRGGRNRLCRAE